VKKPSPTREALRERRDHGVVNVVPNKFLFKSPTVVRRSIALSLSEAIRAAASWRFYDPKNPSETHSLCRHRRMPAPAGRGGVHRHRAALTCSIEALGVEQSSSCWSPAPTRASRAFGKSPRRWCASVCVDCCDRLGGALVPHCRESMRDGRPAHGSAAPPMRAMALRKLLASLIAPSRPSCSSIADSGPILSLKQGLFSSLSARACYTM